MALIKPKNAKRLLGFYLHWLDLTALEIDADEKAVWAEVIEEPNDLDFTKVEENEELGTYTVSLNIPDLLDPGITDGFFSGGRNKWCIECEELKGVSLFQFYVRNQDECRKFLELGFRYFPTF